MYWMTHDGPTNWTRCGYPLGKKREKKLKHPKKKKQQESVFDIFNHALASVGIGKSPLTDKF